MRSHTASLNFIKYSLGVLWGLVWILCGTAALLAYYLLHTTSGSQFLTGLVINHWFSSEQVSVRRISGNLSDGLILEDIIVSPPIDPGSILMTPEAKSPRVRSLNIDQLTLFPLTSWDIQEVHFEMHDIQLRPTSLAQEFTIDRLEGSLARGAVFSDIRLSGLQNFPQESTVEIQRLETALPFRFENIRAIHNGRLHLLYSDPLLFSGAKQEGKLHLQIYSKAVDVHELVDLFVSDDHPLSSWKGTVNEVIFSATGQKDKLVLKGDAQVTKLSRRNVTLTDCPAVFSLEVHPLAEPDWKLFGEVACPKGVVLAKQTTIHLQPSKILWMGNPYIPGLEIKGVSTVGGTHIHILLKGNKAQPELRLSSNPPMSQGTLLAMLVTGKRWKGAQAALSQGAIPSDLALDFIDYAFFGGLGARLARRFGISDLSFSHDTETRRMGVQTTIADKVAVGVEVTPLPPIEPDATTALQTQKSNSPIPYKLEAEVQITEDTSVGIEGERTLRSPTQSVNSQPETEQSDPIPTTDDTVLLKIKRRF